MRILISHVSVNFNIKEGFMKPENTSLAYNIKPTEIWNNFLNAILLVLALTVLWH